MKKKLALVLAAIVAASVLSGCTSSKEAELQAEIDRLQAELDGVSSSSSADSTTSITESESSVSVTTTTQSATSSQEAIQTTSTTESTTATSPIEEYKEPEELLTMDDGIFRIENGVLLECYSPVGDIVIPEGVIEIGESVFYTCDELTSVTLPDGLVRIGDEAFVGCTNLSDISFPESVNSIGYCSFLTCWGLRDITLPDDLSELHEYSFDRCEDISITYRNNTYSYNDMENLCNEICYDENGLFISKNGTLIDCFTNVTGSVTIPDTATAIEDRAFEYCRNITDINITKNVATIGEFAFAHCDKLTSIALPDAISGIYENCIYDCSSLNSITYCGNNYGYNSRDLKNLCRAICYDENGLYIKDGILLDCLDGFEGNISIPNTVTEIRDRAFESCYWVTGIEIPDSVKLIGEYAFASCVSLTDITMPESVEEIGDTGSGAFWGCDKIAVSYMGTVYHYNDISSLYTVINEH